PASMASGELESGLEDSTFATVCSAAADGSTTQSQAIAPSAAAMCRAHRFTNRLRIRSDEGTGGSSPVPRAVSGASRHALWPIERERRNQAALLVTLELFLVITLLQRAADIAAVTADDGDVLLAVGRIGHDAAVGSGAEVELPQHAASLGIERLQL